MSTATILILVLLIAANALYVAAEFAAVGVRQSRVAARADAGGLVAKRLLQVVADTPALDRYIATCQVGITFSSLVLGAYGQITLTPELAPRLQASFDLSFAAGLSLAAVIVLVALTAAQVILGELVPKSVALQYPTRTAVGTFLPVHWSSRLLAPFIWILNGSALVLLRLFRLPPGSHKHVHSPEEIEALVVESRSGGLIGPAEHDRLRAALRLRRTPASDLMVPLANVVAVAEENTLETARERVTTSPYTRLPTYTDGDPARITGLVHTKDLFLHQDATGRVTELKRPIARVPATMPGDRLLSILRDERAQLAAVEDTPGHAIGVVAFEDVLGELLPKQNDDEVDTDD